MISDESDEDADAQDDDVVLDPLLGPDVVDREVRGAGASAAASLQDWPPSHPHPHELDASVDVETLAWFRSNHADWRAAMSSVLRAWVEAKN